MRHKNRVFQERFILISSNNYSIRGCSIDASMQSGKCENSTRSKKETTQKEREAHSHP